MPPLPTEPAARQCSAWPPGTQEAVIAWRVNDFCNKIGQKQKFNLFRESLEDSHNWQNVAYLISLIWQISAWFKNYPVFSFENANKNKELVSFIGWGPNGKRLAF